MTLPLLILLALAASYLLGLTIGAMIRNADALDQRCDKLANRDRSAGSVSSFHDNAGIR